MKTSTGKTVVGEKSAKEGLYIREREWMGLREI